MRRKDREVKNIDTIYEYVSLCDCIRIGLVEDGMAYIVPMNFGYEVENGKLYFYIHSASEGQKIDIMKNNNLLSFELDTSHELVEANEACKYSYNFISIMGHGKLEFINDNLQKSKALKLLMQHTVGKCDFNFLEIMLKIVTIIKIEVLDVSCKQHK